jgi:hypothetical protein
MKEARPCQCRFGCSRTIPWDASPDARLYRSAARRKYCDRCTILSCRRNRGKVSRHDVVIG